MALLLFEGFDHWSLASCDDISNYHPFLKTYGDAGANDDITVVSGRYGGKCVKVGPSAGTPELNSVQGISIHHQGVFGRTELVAGVAFKGKTSEGKYLGGTVLAFMTPGNSTFVLSIGTSGTIELEYRSVTKVTSSFTIADDTWHYYELKAYIHDTSGYIEGYVDGVHVGRWDGDTSYVGSVYFEHVWLSGAGIADGASGYYDDLYVLDTSGASHNDFLGPVRVLTLKAQGAGASSSWTPSSGSNHQCVDDDLGSHDGDSTYIQSQTANHIDTYTYEAMSYLPASIFAAGITPIMAAQSGSGGGRVNGVCRLSGANYTGTSMPVLAFGHGSYGAFSVSFPTNPATSASWNAGDISSAEFGIKLEV